MNLSILTSEILTASRKKLFRRQSIFERYATASEVDIVKLEETLNCKIPEDLRYWLLTAGFGELDKNLSIRSGWFIRLQTEGFPDMVAFAMDELADRYAFDPSTGEIFFYSIQESGRAKLANSFHAFLEELLRRDFDIIGWTTEANLQFP